MEGCLYCVNGNECQDELQNSLTGKLIPVPFTLAMFVIGILVVLSKVICS